MFYILLGCWSNLHCPHGIPNWGPWRFAAQSEAVPVLRREEPSRDGRHELFLTNVPYEVRLKRTPLRHFWGFKSRQNGEGHPKPLDLSRYSRTSRFQPGNP